MASLSIITNVLQARNPRTTQFRVDRIVRESLVKVAFVSEYIPKWLWAKDHNGSMKGYAMSKFNVINVEYLKDKSGLRHDLLPSEWQQNVTKCL